MGVPPIPRGQAPPRCGLPPLFINGVVCRQQGGEVGGRRSPIWGRNTPRGGSSEAVAALKVAIEQGHERQALQRLLIVKQAVGLGHTTEAPSRGKKALSL